MFNTKFLGKRKYAVCKKDGTHWTQEEYDNVISIFQGVVVVKNSFKFLNVYKNTLTYISDSVDEAKARYHLWYDQQTEQELKSFTKISYEDLLKQSKMPLLKRRKNDSHKNETPTTPSK